jgi:hypothetical protein
MSDADRYFHEVWLGMVQPIDGLVVSIPVLVDAQCMERQPPQVQQKLRALCTEDLAIADLGQFLAELLGLAPELFDAGDAIPDEVSLYVPEGRQTIRPTLALRKQGAPGHEMLVWDLPAGLDLDRPETTTGPWDYPPGAKLDRLLRHCRVPIGLITNRRALRLVYAPHGESSGAITFRIEDMISVGGRPILDAFVMLLSANRFFGVAPERALPALLAESRTRQANVTNELADQVFEALQILLRGFEAAAERDGRDLLDDALAREGDHLYKGLLTVLLRLVFVLYAEDRALLPVEHPVYASHLSVLALFEQLQADHGAYPDSMSRRFGAWGRLVALFRAVFLGCAHGSLVLPARRGALFNPHEYPFLEGWGPAGGAPITLPEARAEVRVPTVDDETVFRVLEKLLVLDGQRLSYRALDVEQIGSVYEALMGYHVERMPADAVCMRPDRLWLTAGELLEVPPARRAKWLKDTVGLSSAQAARLAEETKDAEAPAVLEALAKLAAGGRHADPALSRARPQQLVLQPGAERRRTSSHYTPRSLSAPIVRRTLEPLLAVMGDAPASERILNLKVCDPAMGSGAFLVEACRFLADAVLAAWTREGKLEALAKEHGDPLLHARRVVAQRCLYGVDKNEAAVELGKLSLWLVTLSKDLPFTFLDHSLRHGDSLVGLDFDQIRAFHWKPPEKEKKKTSNQLELFGREIAVALDDAIQLRQMIGTLGDSPSEDREKARLYWDASDALDRIRLIGDLIVGAFFAHEKDKDREAERFRREGMVRDWLLSGSPAPEELLAMQREIRAKVPAFHWMVEFPEVFYAERPDPLDPHGSNRAAHMDAFMGNPPFLGGKRISTELGDNFGDWISLLHNTSKNTDLCAHFFRRSFALLGDHGALGFVATNSVAQGENRAGGLAWLLANGGVISSAISSMPWPGDAAVTISVIHIARGAITAVTEPVLDKKQCSVINSRLLPMVERPDPVALQANSEKCFSGSYVAGTGFFLTQLERDEIIDREPRSAELIQEYIGGEELTTSPEQGPARYVINFGKRSLEEAEGWPALISIIRNKVKPDREATRLTTGPGGHGKKYWWQYISRCDPLYESIRASQRCLAISQTAKHLAFSWQPTTRVFGHSTYVIAYDSTEHFAILQSRIHESWARLLSSSLEDRLRYTPSDCFETFPFPIVDDSNDISFVAKLGQELYDARARYMADEQIGLTIIYNQIKDPSCNNARIIELRKLHEKLDREVLNAYGWTDIDVPPFCPVNEAGQQQLAIFENAVTDRLFALNAKRAEEELLRGIGTNKKGASAKESSATGSTKARAPKKAAAATKKKPAKARKNAAQLQLASDDAATADDHDEG